MFAILPGNYSHVSEWIWILCIIVVVIVAVAGAYLVIEGIRQSGDCKRWVDQEEDAESEPVSAWNDFVDARRKYDSRPKDEIKPMSVLDWLAKQNTHF